VVQEGERGEGNKRERVVGKAAWDECVFIPRGLADEVGSDATGR
jgi:hypothetical protein